MATPWAWRADFFFFNPLLNILSWEEYYNTLIYKLELVEKKNLQKSGEKWLRYESWTERRLTGHLSNCCWVSFNPNMHPGLNYLFLHAFYIGPFKHFLNILFYSDWTESFQDLSLRPWWPVQRPSKFTSPVNFLPRWSWRPQRGSYIMLAGEVFL